MKTEFRPILIILLSVIHISSAQSTKEVSILWDVSRSMENRDLGKEFYFLDNYFKDVNEANVVLLTFGNRIISREKFKIGGGQWVEIKERLKNQKYDGGTCFAGLEDYSLKDDVLMFTDGKQNLGISMPNFDGELYIINSKKDFDRASLNLLAIINNGNLVNLVENRDLKGSSDQIKEYFGTIYEGTTGLHNAEVYVKGNQSRFSKSNMRGEFQIKAVEGDTLVISYKDNQKEHVLAENLFLNVSFENRGIQLNEVVVTESVNFEAKKITTAYGNENKEKLGYAVQSVSDENILDITTDAGNMVRGKFSGLKLGQNEDLSEFAFRPRKTINAKKHGLIVIDGIPMEQSESFSGHTARTIHIDPQNIAEITALKGLAATNRFGSKGANGVLLITTKTAKKGALKRKKMDMVGLTNNIYDGKIKVSSKILVTPYLKELKKGKNVQEAYTIYLEQQGKYPDTPEYFLDVYTFFYNSNTELANRILTNILEKERPSYNELRGMYLKASEYGNYELALAAADRLLEMFPNKIQSYLDVAMADKRAGNYQEALNMFNNIVNGSANMGLNFHGIEKVVGTEIRNLVNKKKNQLDLSKVDQKYRNNLTYNARLFLDWNNTDAEFVVQMVNPQKRFFNWEHTETADRARILNELQHGFSTEQFEIVGAETIGDWILNVTYLGNRTSGSKTPTFLKCTVEYNFGKPNQTSEEFMVRLQEPGDEQQLAKFTVQ